MKLFLFFLGGKAEVFLEAELKDNHVDDFLEKCYYKCIRIDKNDKYNNKKERSDNHEKSRISGFAASIYQ